MEQAADIKKLKEQRDLLVDLKQKNAMLEREVSLINEQAKKDSDELEGYRYRYSKENQTAAQKLEQNNAIRSKQVLSSVKTELEAAAKTIAQLN